MALEYLQFHDGSRQDLLAQGSIPLNSKGYDLSVAPG